MAFSFACCQNSAIICCEYTQKIELIGATGTLPTPVHSILNWLKSIKKLPGLPGAFRSIFYSNINLMSLHPNL